MGKFDGIVLLSDLDGTLLDGELLSNENINALNYFKAGGGLFAPCTGRAPRFIYDRFPALAPNTYICAINGAVLFDPVSQKIAWSQPMDGAIFDKFKSILDVFPIHRSVTVHTSAGLRLLKGDAQTLLAEFRQIADPILKIVFIQEKDITDQMAEYYRYMPDYVYCRSCPVFLEVSALGTGKGASVQRLRELLGARAGKIICAGDYENDITLLQAADIAVAVEGGFEPLKQYADWIAPPVKEHVAAWLIAKIERELL